MLAPSSLNCTLATATLSAALADTVTVPVKVDPAVGAVIETVGGVVSEAGVVPVSPTWCGLPAALSEMVTEPDWLPATVGENLTLMVQLALAASVEGLSGQVFVCENGAPAAMLEMVRDAVPVLVSVTPCAALVVFTA